MFLTSFNAGHLVLSHAEWVLKGGCKKVLTNNFPIL